MTETLKLYDDMPYETGFKAGVTALSPVPGEDGAIDLILDQTLFFPEEGGQTPDRGEIFWGDQTYEVTDVQIRDEVITHRIRADMSPLPSPGDEVRGLIDWDHRYSNMQNHSGEHIFSGLVHSAFGYDNVGFHLSDHEVTMDYSGPLAAADVALIEEKANAAIRANIPIECAYPDPDELASIAYRSKKALTGPVRIVTIPGVDVCACCAPHVRSTAEVGLLKVISFMSYKGGTRLSILCGGRAVRDYIDKQKELEEISHLLKVPQLRTYDAVGRLYQEREDLKAELSRVRSDLLDREIDGVDKSLTDVILFSGLRDQGLVRKGVNRLTALHEGFSAIFYAPEEAGEGLDQAPAQDPDKGAKKWSYIIGAGKGLSDVRTIQEILKDDLSARGGGKPAMIQGSLTGTKERILSILRT